MSRDMTSTVNTQSAMGWQSEKVLGWLVKCWVGIILTGQWIFALYILVQFTLPMLTGQLSESRYAYMITGYINGETLNNALLLLHVIPVMLISLSGTFQLFPGIRKHYPRFHRINGRVYLSFGLLGAIGGLYLTWVTGSRLSDLGALGVTLNGLLIPVAVYVAWKAAWQRRFTQHKRFAIHAFILINGVWTFRLLLMGWFMLNQGALGNSANLDGPADIILSFSSYLLPMVIAELIFKARQSKAASARLIAIISVLFAIIITLFGTVAATMMMWGPRIIGY
ncbi:DUF2306 domain-containing protein [Aestuariibacter sp. A3R04]|uniref:DUF2306 domain-containing protein n=1 Tax=Aestuariibacter sp. A3R04 TaxID=2841571 RepID=UPI0020914218|nr:DUF2306 domain-containing protein [Aestuariibacter sp. A3R04]